MTKNVTYENILRITLIDFYSRDVLSEESLDRLGVGGHTGGRINRGRNSRHHHRFAATAVEYIPSNGLRGSAHERPKLHYSAPGT